MSWSITIADDADTTGQHTVTGVWTEGDESVSVTVRCRPDEKGIAEFITAAVKARDGWQTKKAAEKNFISTCLAKLNREDPKATEAVK
jgi:hypothetical protein